MGKKRSKNKSSKKKGAIESDTFVNLNIEDELKNIPENLIQEGNDSSVSDSVIENNQLDFYDVSDPEESISNIKSLKEQKLNEKLQDERLRAILTNTNKNTEKISLNVKYQRTRRYDNTGEYRIGPSFISKSRLSYLDESKPAKLSVEPTKMKSVEFGLLIYFWKFTDQYDKQEIDLDFVQSLIDSGCDINCRDEYGQTILHAIVRDWHPDVALFAIHNNIDVNVQDKYGRSPLHLAAALNCKEMAKVLLDNGADIELLTENEKQSPTHFAAKYNSVETLTVLLRKHGSFFLKDSEGKTPLFLAAEYGSSKTAQLLLDLEAPIGVYDNDGNFCLSYLIEKMPDVAYQALNQFKVANISLGRNEVYLSYLEKNPNSKVGNFTKVPLEMITIYDEYDLIMHPVIQTMLEVKWKKLGRFITLRQLFILFIYLSCWMVLAYLFDPSGIYYKPLKVKGWKIILEIIIIAAAVFFFYEDVTRIRETVKAQTAWVEMRRHKLRSKYPYCHPAWPSDRQNVDVEIERLQGSPSLAKKQQFWIFYEFSMLIIIAAIIITRIIDAYISTKASYLTHKCIFAIGLMISFLRVLKICIRFRYFAVYLKVAGLAIRAFIQIAFFYLQFFIPFVAVFWVTFGVVPVANSNVDNSNISNLSNTTNFTESYNFSTATNISNFLSTTISTTSSTTISEDLDLRGLDGIFYHVYESSFGQDDLFMLSTYDKYAAQTLISLYTIFTTFICLTVLVALITSAFTTSYKKCVAQASLLQASMLLQFEKKLSKKQQKEMAFYYAQECTPLIIKEDVSKESAESVIRNLTSKLERTERNLADINEIIFEAEKKENEEGISAKREILENIFTNISLLKEKQKENELVSKAALKDLAEKETHINRCITKLIKLQASTSIPKK
ncbi:uncharacterized protein LOC100209684 isoform X1 [Hydra vulgaris]|uniref:uncharacterized protein LOC100209684 isoform X1 n=1 Tax=Hydra vulgaris TaxID=6087 RepID=UPI0006415351|nr:uncharacterized protein LOC100209684 [Hydra vulgaris]